MTEDATAQAGEATAKRAPRAKMAARIVLALALIVLIFWYLLKDISLADVWAAITAMTWIELAGLVVVAGWNLLTYAFVWMTVRVVTSGVRRWYVPDGALDVTAPCLLSPAAGRTPPPARRAPAGSAPGRPRRRREHAGSPPPPRGRRPARRELG